MSATTIAARAVAIRDRAGSLTPGFPADLAVMAAPDLNHWLYHFSARACTAVMKSSKSVHGQGCPVHAGRVRRTRACQERNCESIDPGMCFHRRYPLEFQVLMRITLICV